MEGATNGHHLEPELEAGRELNFLVTLASHEEIDIQLRDIDFAEPGAADSLTSLLGDAITLQPAHYIKTITYVWEQGLHALAIDVAEKGIAAFRKAGQIGRGITLLAILVTYNLTLSRLSPKVIIPDAKYTNLTKEVAKDVYLAKALTALQEAESVDSNNLQVLEARTSIMVATLQFENALKTAEQIIARESTNIIAQMAKARTLIARRTHRQALKLYQSILRLSPRCLPDPRIGIGICFWHLGDQITAQKAWERSIAMHGLPKAMPAYVLMGLSLLNQAKAMDENDEEYAEVFRRAIGYLQDAFKSVKTVASSSVALAGYFLARSEWNTTARLAERALQYADTKILTAEAHYLLARSLHGQDLKSEAIVEYTEALKIKPDFTAASLGGAHILITAQQLPPAADAYENALLKRPGCIEVLIGLAALHSHLAFSATTEKDALVEQEKAKEKYDEVLRMLASVNLPDAQIPAGSSIRRIRAAGQDSAMYIEVARLWATTDQARSLKAYQTSRNVRQDAGEPVTAVLYNNIGCLEYARKEYRGAKEAFEEALRAAAEDQENVNADAIRNTVGYNFAIINEATGDIEVAKNVYNSLLQSHPEWFEAKARLGLIYLSEKNYEGANEIFKEALSTATRNSELRALYTYYLVQSRQEKAARDFAVITLKEPSSRNDVYAMCANGVLLYQSAREIRPSTAEQLRDKMSKNIRSAEFFDRALQLDPACAIAAQGIAIILAEGTLLPPGQTGSADTAARSKNSRDALNILAKVRDTSGDGSVYVNLGHVHSARDEWEKAIEHYETASRRYYKETNSACLLYLARSWYQKANKDQSFTAIKSALQCAHAALNIQTKDDGIRFNIAIICHKGLEIVSELPPNRRSLAQIREAINHANEAQDIFTSLAAKPQGSTYPVDIAQQRVRYGTGLVSRANGEVIQTQEQYEASAQAKLDKAKVEREQERQRIKEAEAAKLEAIRLNNEKIAEERRLMQEEASRWYAKPDVDMLSDDENKKKARGRGGRKKAARDEDEGAGADDDGQDRPKKAAKRKNPGGRSKKAKTAATGADEGSGDDQAGPTAQDGSGAEDEARPAKKSRTKIYKSAEYVEDSE